MCKNYVEPNLEKTLPTAKLELKDFFVLKMVDTLKKKKGRRTVSSLIPWSLLRMLRLLLRGLWRKEVLIQQKLMSSWVSMMEVKCLR